MLPSLLHGSEGLLRRRQIARLQGLAELTQALAERVLRASRMAMMGVGGGARYADGKRRKRLPGGGQIARLQRLSNGVQRFGDRTIAAELAGRRLRQGDEVGLRLRQTSSCKS